MPPNGLYSVGIEPLVKINLSTIIHSFLIILWDNSKFWKEKVEGVEFYYFAYVRNIINKLFNLNKGAQSNSSRE